MLATKHSRARSLDVDPRLDERVILHDVPWSQYESLLATRGESAVPRLTYLERDLEIMTPSWEHADLKKWIAQLFEAYVDELELPCTPMNVTCDAISNVTTKARGRRVPISLSK